MQIISIVPRLYPAIDGVGDYALNLARQLRSDFGVRTHFLTCDLLADRISQLDDFPISQINIQSPTSLITQLATIEVSNFLLLHYVGYGYAKRGCPSWLVNGLETWKYQFPHCQLATVFHEISASGPIWTSAFWLSARQINLAKRLIQASDRIITSKHSYADILESYAPDRFDTIPTLPVFSTVGELQNPSRLSKRARRLVIFGGRRNRSKVYKESLEPLRQICRHLDIQQIFDIGPSLDLLPTCIDAVPINAVGCLASQEISAILADSVAGFFSYHPAFLGKSTIFAAYCAHRVIPISATMSDLSEEGLQPGKHYALPVQYSSDDRDMELMQAIADNAHDWYQSHNLATHANQFAVGFLGHP